MLLPLNEAKIVAFCGGIPETVTDFATGAQKIDQATGAPLVAVPAVFVMDGRPEVATVKVPSPPTNPIPALTLGAPLTFTDLVATTWSMGERSGVSFRASSVTTGTAPAPAPAPAPVPSPASASSSVRDGRSGS